jgi:hypothetical protein
MRKREKEDGKMLTEIKTTRRAVEDIKADQKEIKYEQKG